MSEAYAPMIPAVAVQAESRYVLGFPILVGIVLRNETADTDYLDVPALGLLHPIESVGVTLEPVDGGQVIRLGPSFELRDQNVFRTELMAGHTKRSLIDLTQFGGQLHAGRYRMQVSVFGTSHVARASASVPLELDEPSPADSGEGARLRRLGLRANDVDAGSWSPFLTNNWHTVSVSPTLGRPAAHQLSLHVALHRAAYGPEPLSQVPLALFRGLTGPVLSEEAIALGYELVMARDAAAAGAARSKAIAAYPDLRATLDDIDAGRGVLRTLRTGYGAERETPAPPGERPYTVTRPPG